MLGWSTARLGRVAEVDQQAIASFETGARDVIPQDAVNRLRSALEWGDKAGRVQFIMTGEFAGGVTFRPSQVRDESWRNPRNPNVPG